MIRQILAGLAGVAVFMGGFWALNRLVERKRRGR
jgi:hypothetical protein